MSTQTFYWKSSEKLGCLDCLPANVVICLSPDLIAQKPCYLSEEDTAFSWHTILGEVVAYVKQLSDCCVPTYTYTIEYDDTQVIAPFNGSEVSGIICEDCIVSWVVEQAGNDVYVRDNGDGTLTFVSQHGCEFTFATGGGGETNFWGNFIFGDGSDGDLVVANGDNLMLPTARNYYFHDLTIDAGGILHPYAKYIDSDFYGCPRYSWYQIFVSGTLTINGALAADGPNGADAVAEIGGDRGRHFSPPCADVYFNDSNVGPGGTGADGSIGGNGAFGFTPAQDGSVLDFGGQTFGGGVGGAGGNGGVVNGFRGLGLIPNANNDGSFIKTSRFLFGLYDWGQQANYIGDSFSGGIGGGGGGGGGIFGGASNGGGGGGGAAAGGTAYLAARNIVIGRTGKISANGGNGGAGADATDGGAAAGGGGGGGGAGGGLLYLLYESLTNAGSIEVTPGTGGVGGAGVNGGPAGAAGDSGSAGNICRLNFSTGEFE